MAANPRARLEQFYGLQFPESFFAFWDFAQAHSALSTVLGIGLIGPFDILRGSDHPQKNSRWKGRYYNDPPEFLTFASGDTDGLHWGYYIDDPQKPAFPVASFYSNDAFQISLKGETIFAAIRQELEATHESCVEYMDDDPTEKSYYEARIGQLALLRSALQTYETGEQREIGKQYLRKYGVRRLTIALTRDDMGIVVPKESYIPLSSPDPFQIWNHQPSEKEVQESAAEARQLLAQGYPGAALKLGKDLWIYQEFRETSYELLDEAYTALDRDLLRQWLKVAIAYRQDCDAKWSS
jgi:hypothetical protein